MTNINIKRILLRPVLTEKSMQMAEVGKYCFVVTRESNKKEIAKAVKSVFAVEPVTVSTQVRPGKTKRAVRTRKMIHKPAYKLAVVSLKKGEKIPGFDKALNLEATGEDKDANS